MPQIVVLSDSLTEGRAEAVVHRERVNVTDFESNHFAQQLLERLGWAVGDAHTIESRHGAKAVWEAPPLNELGG